MPDLMLNVNVFVLWFSGPKNSEETEFWKLLPDTTVPKGLYSSHNYNLMSSFSFIFSSNADRDSAEIKSSVIKCVSEFETIVSR